uniref:Uncharacterized protein n=1 Tax=Opuntia streptacantha TaxID=393608 RepID=A0A7C8ZHS6_OPUST
MHGQLCIGAQSHAQPCVVAVHPCVASATTARPCLAVHCRAYFLFSSVSLLGHLSDLCSSLKSLLKSTCNPSCQGLFLTRGGGVGAKLARREGWAFCRWLKAKRPLICKQKNEFAI